MSSKTFYIEHLGCAKNQVDAEVMAGSMKEEGWRAVTEASEAELIIVNSCGFVGEAREQSIDVALAIRKKHPHKKILLAGCISERYGGSLKNLLPEIDGIFGNRSPSRVAELVDDVQAGKKPVLLPQDYEPTPQASFSPSPSSVYVKIAEGCDNRCSYCAIPLIRGSLRSRSIDDIATEVSDLASTGCREVLLIAQDLAAFGNDRGKDELLELLIKLLDISGDFWIRLLYIHPDHFPLDIIDLCATDPRLLPYFDLPFQHVSSRILNRMGRQGSAGSYARLVNTIRERLPDAVIRSTFLLGFPGEGEGDFQELHSFLESTQLDWVGFFCYSREEGTPAYKMDRLAALTKPHRERKVRERIEKLKRTQEMITGARLDRFVGRNLDVIVEDVLDRERYLGRGYLQAPDVDGSVVISGGNLSPGMVVSCKIYGRAGIDLQARYISTGSISRRGGS